MTAVTLRVVVGLLGVALVGSALTSAIITLVLPRGGNTRTADRVTRLTRWVLTRTTQRGSTRRERALAMLAPVALLLMPIAWLLQIWFGFAGLYLATGLAHDGRAMLDSAWQALYLSGSSLLTLGFATGDRVVHHLLTFTEATLGLGVVTLLIAYLPTM